MMSIADESASRARQTQDKASRARQTQDKVRELNERAEQASDPKERRRLYEEARRMQERSLKEGGRAAEDRSGRRADSERDGYSSR
ncbi:DUF6381 family protein [Streptomyces sp. NPDC057486]|uniref:DUF6381 family protein n=1 Tax=Streptomyces sp. NPDC057486 TaxID=3346145 RepID=UPI0036C672B5